MGGRGGSSGMGGGGENVNIVGSTDVWSYRHNQTNEPFVDAINTGVKRIHDDFPGIMDTVASVDAAELGGKDKLTVLGFYSSGDKTVALNLNFTDVDKMNRVYDQAVARGYHPSRGNLSGTESVALHEMGHALTDHIAKKLGLPDLDAASRKIFMDAYKATKGKGKYKDWAGKISGYAKENYAESVAEAVADFYCNGRNAHPHSIAIMDQLRKYK